MKKKWNDLTLPVTSLIRVNKLIQIQIQIHQQWAINHFTALVDANPWVNTNHEKLTSDLQANINSGAPPKLLYVKNQKRLPKIMRGCLTIHHKICETFSNHNLDFWR
jgi:hypothetical protein